MFEQLTILAPGLIRTSVAMAAKEKNLVRRITVWARRAETRAACSNLPWCDKVFEHPEQAVAGSDFIVVCSPVESICPLVNNIANNLKPEKITGLDISETAIKLCNSLYDVKNLNFVSLI